MDAHTHLRREVISLADASFPPASTSSVMDDVDAADSPPADNSSDPNDTNSCWSRRPRLMRAAVPPWACDIFSRTSACACGRSLALLVFRWDPAGGLRGCTRRREKSVSDTIPARVNFAGAAILSWVSILNNSYFLSEEGVLLRQHPNKRCVI